MFTARYRLGLSIQYRLHVDFIILNMCTKNVLTVLVSILFFLYPIALTFLANLHEFLNCASWMAAFSYSNPMFMKAISVFIYISLIYPTFSEKQLRRKRRAGYMFMCMCMCM